MGLDQHAHLRGHKVDWDKYYEDDKEENEKVFVWRKHARLQQFMSAKWDEQNTTHKHEGHLAHLGFNADEEAPVYITEKVAKELAEQIEKGFADYEAEDGFFWGQQFQEETVKEYKAQDLNFVKWAKQEIKDGNKIFYSCSW